MKSNKHAFFMVLTTLAPRCLLWVTLLGRLSLHSAARRLFKVESDINGILPAGGGPLPFISFLP